MNGKPLPRRQGVAVFATLKRATVALALLVVVVAPARAAGGDEHLLLGNPSKATDDPAKRDNYRLKNRQWALS